MKLIKLPKSNQADVVAKFDEAVTAFRARLTTTSGRIGEEFKFEHKLPENLDVPTQLKETLIRPRIAMSAATYCKMLNFVIRVDTESAWHGNVTRHPDNVFAITDVYAYPQKVSAAYVESDDDAYPQWEATLTNEQYLHRRFQAHSHVNMGVSPSGTDTSNQKLFMNDLLNYIDLHPEATIEELNAMNAFYIFAIMNKRQEINWWIYDYTTNVMYEKEDIDFTVLFKDEYTLESLQEEITKYIKPRYVQPTYNQGIYRGHQSGFGVHMNNDFDDYDDNGHDWRSTYNQNNKSNVTILPSKPLNKIWEIKCSHEKARIEFMNSEFYKNNKQFMFAQKDPNINFTFFYALDDEIAKKVPFLSLRDSKFYQQCQGLIVMEIDRPAWYPPKDTKDTTKPKDKRQKRRDKILERLEDMMNKGETPYILVDTKREKFNEINGRHFQLMDVIGQFTDITFQNAPQPKACFCIYNIEFIEDDQLDCILELQAAGFAFRSVKLEQEEKK